MRLPSPDGPDHRLVLQGWWFVCAPATIAFLVIIWAPIAWFGIDRVFWRGATGLVFELFAFLAAFAAGAVWKIWARPRWTAWAYPRATDLDALKVRAMLDGVVSKDRAFLAEIAAKSSTTSSS